MGQAVQYTLRQWGSLIQYLDIDNNTCKRAIRPFAVGRKNWLFMGNVRGAKALQRFTPKCDARFCNVPSSRIAPGQKEETSNYRYMCVDGGVVDNSAGWAALVFAVSNRNEDINAYNMDLEGSMILLYTIKKCMLKSA